MMPRHWIEALFKKFLLRYGQLWADRYKGLGLSPDEIADEWATELDGFSAEEIKRGLDACRANKFPPTLPEFLTACRPASSVRPSADEAWALAIKAKDESETVVWTEDMAQAWGLCKPVLDAGDDVGARMAFRAAYERISGLGGPVRWTVSHGWDAEKRVIALERAKSAGLALPYAPQPVLMLEEKTAPMPDYVKEMIASLKQVERPSIAERARQWTAQRKAEEAAKIEHYRNKA